MNAASILECSEVENMNPFAQLLFWPIKNIIFKLKLLFFFQLPLLVYSEFIPSFSDTFPIFSNLLILRDFWGVWFRLPFTRKIWVLTQPLNSTPISNFNQRWIVDVNVRIKRSRVKISCLLGKNQISHEPYKKLEKLWNAFLTHFSLGFNIVKLIETTFSIIGE